VGFGGSIALDALPALYAAPVWEEVLFRGFLCSALLAILTPGGGAKERPTVLNKSLAILLSAILFSACLLLGSGAKLKWSSLPEPELLDRAISGICFGAVWSRSKSLLPAILMHAVTNLTLVAS